MRNKQKFGVKLFIFVFFISCVTIIGFQHCFLNIYKASAIGNKLEDTAQERNIAQIGKINVPHGTAYDYLTDFQKTLYDAIYISSADYSKIPQVTGKTTHPTNLLQYSYKFYESSTTDFPALGTGWDMTLAGEALRDDFPEKVINWGFVSHAICYGKEKDKYVAYMVTYYSEQVCDLNKIENQVNGIVSQIVNQSKSSTKAESELKAHDLLVQYVDYDLNCGYSGNNCYGVFVNKKAWCEGYAMAFDMIMKKLGIDCLNIQGSGGLGPHQWNIVKLDDGKWYEVDPTFAEDETHEYFNRTTYDYANKVDMGSGHIRYNKVNSGDDAPLSGLYPEATGTTYTYAYLRPGYTMDGKKKPSGVQFTSPVLPKHYNPSDYSMATIECHVGDTITLSHTVVPADADDLLKESFEYSLNDEMSTVLSLSGTQIKALAPGFERVYVSGFGHVTDAFAVRVLDEGELPSANQDTGTVQNEDTQDNKISGVNPVAEEPIDKSIPTPKKLSVKSAKKVVDITWKKQNKNTKGYEIQYSTDKNFKNDVKKTSAKKTSTSKTIKKLKSGKTYYIRIRTKSKKNGKTVYSKWSSTKKVKIK